MPLVVPNVGEIKLLDNMLKAENRTLRLYSGAITPAEGDTLATYSGSEASFTGYSAKTLTGASWPTPTTNGANAAESSYAQQSWSATSTQTINGYYVVAADTTTLVWAESITPIGLTNPSTLNLTPKFTAE